MYFRMGNQHGGITKPSTPGPLQNFDDICEMVLLHVEIYVSWNVRAHNSELKWSKYHLQCVMALPDIRFGCRPPFLMLNSRNKFVSSAKSTCRIFLVNYPKRLSLSR